MNHKQFTIEELHELEELQIMGGKGPDGTNAHVQNQCENRASGCGGDALQNQCINSADNCGTSNHGNCGA